MCVYVCVCVCMCASVLTSWQTHMQAPSSGRWSCPCGARSTTRAPRCSASWAAQQALHATGTAPGEDDGEGVHSHSSVSVARDREGGRGRGGERIRMGGAAAAAAGRGGGRQPPPAQRASPENNAAPQRCGPPSAADASTQYAHPSQAPDCQPYRVSVPAALSSSALASSHRCHVPGPAAHQPPHYLKQRSRTNPASSRRAAAACSARVLLQRHSSGAALPHRLRLWGPRHATGGPGAARVRASAAAVERGQRGAQLRSARGTVGSARHARGSGKSATEPTRGSEGCGRGHRGAERTEPQESHGGGARESKI